MAKVFRTANRWFRSDNRKSARGPADQKRPRGLKWLGFAVIAFVIVAAGAVAQAQQTGKVFRIGFLDNGTASSIGGLLDAFRQELRKLGWIEGKNVMIEYRFAEQKPE